MPTSGRRFVRVPGVSVRIEEIKNVTDDVVAAFRRLLPQLSRSAEPLDRTAVAEIVDCPTNTVFVAHGDDGIVGMLTLVMFPVPWGCGPASRTSSWMGVPAAKESVGR